tara:strand:- start:411 stop:557 length:147 start_codon:yes stop_codon:yes gene_type:complete
MIDSLKTTAGSVGTIAMNYTDLLTDIQSLIIGGLWIIYLYNKIKWENK